MTPTSLTPKMIDDLAKSGITPEVAAAAGWHSESDPKRLQSLLGWKYPAKTLGACLVIPYHDAGGEPTGYVRLKPATPLTENRDGKSRVRKYEAPKGQRPHAFFPPATRATLADPTALLLLSEGEKKALAASDVYGFPCVGLSGVDCWRAKGGKGQMLPELAAVAWAGRPVAIVFDADAATNPRVVGAEQELAAALAKTGAVVTVVRLPGPEKGLDDFLTVRGPDALSALLDAAPPFAPAPPAGEKTAAGKAWTAAEDDRAFAEATAGQAEARQAAKDPKPLVLLREWAKKQFELFRSADGIAFASKDGVTAIPVESTAFKDGLYRLYERASMSAHEPATPHLIGSAVAILAAHARTSGVKPVLMRSGMHDGTAYIHRGDPEAMGEVVAVDPSGWRTVRTPPVRFALGPAAGILPAPAAAGDVAELRPFLNLDDPDQFPLVAAWVGAAVLSAWPVPVLMLTGQQGTAKSTAAKVLLRLIDPAAGDDPLRGRPKDEETLAVAARNAHLLAFDNLSGMDNDLADLLCRVATGGAFATRTKYTNSDETRIAIRKAIILTGIDLPSLRGDLLERGLTVRLRPIPDGERLTEEEFFRRFAEARPRILAGLYALIARGLAPAPALAGMRLPRMADFGRFAAAAVGREAVEGKLAAVAQDNAAAALDAYPWVPPLVELMRHRQVPWTGTAAELLAELEAKYREGNYARRGDLPKRWPGGPHVLSGQLDRIAPALLAVEGIRVERQRASSSDRSKVVRITRTHDEGEASEPPPTKRPRLGTGLLDLLGV